MTENREGPAQHFLLRRYDRESEEYRPPSDDELRLLRSDAPRDFEFLVNDPSSKIDNRSAVRLLLALRNIRGEEFHRLAEPYDLGFYKKSDGKSHPVWFLRVPKFLRILGFRKDIVAVRHDFDYYRGHTGEFEQERDRYNAAERLRADRHYKEGQIAIGLWRWAAAIEFLAIRALGWWTWRRHRRRFEQADDYGTIDYIPQLSDKY